MYFLVVCLSVARSDVFNMLKGCCNDAATLCA